jgi:hypothetical protein
MKDRRNELRRKVRYIPELLMGNYSASEYWKKAETILRVDIKTGKVLENKLKNAGA